MSLRPDDRYGGRGRSASVSGRDRSRSRSNVRAPDAPRPSNATRHSSYGYPAASAPMPGSFGEDVTSPTYEVRSPPGMGKAEDRNQYFAPASSRTMDEAAPRSTAMPYPESDHAFAAAAFPDYASRESGGYAPSTQNYYPPPRKSDNDLAYGGDDHRPRDGLSRQSSNYRYTPQTNEEIRYAQAPQQVTYTAKPQGYPTSDPPSSRGEDSYRPGFAARPEDHYRAGYTSAPPNSFPDQSANPYAHNGYGQGAQVVDITPGREKLERTNSAPRAHRLSAAPEMPLGLQPPRSPGLAPRLDRLSVSGNRPDLQSIGGGLPPPSPLLEAYHGTYQSISPMPLAIRPDDDLDLEDLPPLSPTVSRNHHKHNDRLERDAEERDRKDQKKKKKSVTMYDAEDDAKTIAKALSHHKVDAAAICDVLPALSHDQVMELRKEYKKQVKVQGKGVNISKHIKTKITGNFGKVVYITSLGKFESEGYWANFWYQSHGSRRELLIESLMGRSNAEIRMIKDDFKDKRYSDSLTKCMEKELKMDKFRTAVLMVLEERRQEEQDVFPPEYVHRDVDLLSRAVRAERGGETAMLEIIVRRSDAHLREVLKLYERMHGENFARSALKRSNNLVGEVIAHILNGVINKPARDALLLQHAIRDIAEHNKEDELRYELLISRLVRIHWDKLHLMRVKKEYYEKYHSPLEHAIEDATKGDFREFVCELCETK